ncbi:hypothetical protein RFI_18153 [Reticulomyxa filosa]|uniref:PH domain-containing protein n=1 Tax=Reticulomyxa filosa TaxID=46433 RepID=X6MYH6_RETFI|nr:hypothetical protein RFI_18153 [Reticulomyxa filosa]|eukprot:ETO19085.1 hypothetical protein RFI_18153 [Reticulomyxa filosa]
MNVYVKIEQCAKQKFKTLLDAPMSRLPQYLQQMANVYKEWKEAGKQDNEGSKQLWQAIVDIKKMTDEISNKCRDQKARQLLGHLQKELFNDKISLTAAHRLCVRHGELKIVKNKGLHTQMFILCNDILVISTVGSRWKSSELVAVFPLIGLRVLHNPLVDESLQSETKFRFAVVPQNKNFALADSTTMGSVIIVCAHEAELQAWVDEIEQTVDEEEHNLRPCNPVDLEKRLRREPTCPEGSASTVTITDPVKIEAIEQWRKHKEESRFKVKLKTRNQMQSTVIMSADCHHVNASSNPPLASIHPPPPPPPPPPPRPPSSNKRLTTNSAPSQSVVSSKSPDITSHSMTGLASRPPPPPLLHSQQTQVVGQSSPTVTVTTASSLSSSSMSTNTRPSQSQSSTKATLLGQIAGFQKDLALKKVNIEETQAAARSIHDPQDVASLLQTTLANYRIYVQGDSDDEESEDNDEDWE